jgi:putative phosphoribosyl transferase
MRKRFTTTAFADRLEAGRALAERLAPVVEGPCVVAAIPRGGVPVAMPIVERLGAPLAVVYARKLTSPAAPELAFGALDEDGESLLDRSTVTLLGLTPHDVDEARARVAAEIRRRMELYRVPPLARHLPDRTVVLVDDGLATGLTMRAAVAYARRHRARSIVVAVPCASTSAAGYFERAADHLVSLVVDPDFVAVGAYYADFSPVPDEQVVAMLHRARSDPAGPSAPGRRVSFETSRGLHLAGELLLPDRAGRHPTVAIAHGWGSSKASPRNRSLAQALVAEGLGALLFDFTGHGDSQGTMEDSTRDQQVDDLRAALDVLATLDDVDPQRLGVAGASSGAAVGLELAARDDRVRALALRSGNFVGVEDVARRVAVPTLLVVGERDEAIARLNEAVLARLAGARRLEIVPGGDHLFEDPVARRCATALMVDWLAMHLGRAGRSDAVRDAGDSRRT